MSVVSVFLRSSSLPFSLRWTFNMSCSSRLTFLLSSHLTNQWRDGLVPARALDPRRWLKGSQLWERECLPAIYLSHEWFYLKRVTRDGKLKRLLINLWPSTRSRLWGERKSECSENTLEVRLRSTETQPVYNICSKGGRRDWCPLRQPDFPRSTAQGIYPDGKPSGY